MKFPQGCFLLHSLLLLLLRGCHLEVSYPADSPDLQSYLSQSPCSSLTLDLPLPSSPILFTSMTSIKSLMLYCNGATLLLETTLVVRSDAELWLFNCTLAGGKDVGLMHVQGNLTLSNCSVYDNHGYGFLIEGHALVLHSRFEYNHGSIFLASRLGISIIVGNSLFRSNESPLGAVLQLSVTSLNSLSTTLISFEDSIFSNNSAALGGAFMHVSIERSGVLASDTANERLLLVRNCQFSDSSGYLWHLFLTYVQAKFINNTIANVTVPLYLQIYSDSLQMENTTITTVEKAVVCPYITGQVFIWNLHISNSSQGPALLFSHTAATSPGLVMISCLTLRHATQIDYTQYASTLYVLNVLATVEHIWVQDSYSFASACGAFFFTESWVRNCTFADSSTHQGGLIGYMGGRGAASRLVMRGVTTETVGALLTMQAQVNFSHISMVSSGATQISLLNNLLVFISSEVTLTDITLDLPHMKSELVIKAQLSTVHFTQLHFSLLQIRTFCQIITSNVTFSNITAEGAEISSFVLAYAQSKVNISEISMRNWVIMEDLVTAKADCIVNIAHIEIYGGVCESLVHAFDSQVHFSDVVLSDAKAGTLFTAYIGGEIHISSSQISNITCNLILCEHGLVMMIHTRLWEVSVRKRLVTLMNATVILQYVEVFGLYATTVSPLILASANSTFQLYSSMFTGIRSREKGLLHFKNSFVHFDLFSLSDFNASFAYLSRCEFSVFHTQVANGGARTGSAGFLQLSESNGFVRMSRFSNVSGAIGGVLALASSSVEITDASFVSCSASDLGGVVSAVSSGLNISQCTFYENSARVGGVIYFQCDEGSICPAAMKASEFVNNSAIEGGVIKWTRVKPAFAALTCDGNKAVYGDFEASLPTHIALASNLSALTGVAGVRVVSPIIVASFDINNQTVLTDNSTTVQLVSDHLRGTTSLFTVNGFASFSGVIVDTSPGTSVQIQAVSSSILQTFPNSSHSFSFVYHTRTCVSGEITLPLSCFLCPKNTYSLLPSETFCRECPHYASCPGGNVLDLDSGYWRASNLSAEVYLCPNPAACKGGENATCSEEYTGELCNGCSPGYYMRGSVVCQECEGTAVATIRSFVICLFVIGIFLSIANKINLKSGQMPSIRILANFLHFLLVLPLIPVNWQVAMTGFLSFSEMIVSFGQTSLSIDCWMARDAQDSATYWKAILATLFPPCFFLLIFAVSCLQAKSITGKQAARAISATVLLLWWTQPYVLKAIIAVVACKRQVSHWRLSSDPEVACWEGQHLKFALALSLPAFLVYGVAYQVCFAMLLKRRILLCKQKLKTRFYRAGLEKKYRSWEAVNAVKKEMLIVSTALLQATDYIFQVFFVVAGLYVAITCFIKSKEHTIPVLHRLTGFGLLLEVYFAAFSYYFVARLGLKSYILILLSSLITTVSIVFILVCALQIRRLRVLPAEQVNREVSQEPISEESFNSSAFVPPQSPASTPTPGLRADTISLEISGTH